MIARLKGILEEVNLTQCIIDVHGVGYEVFIPMSTFDKLPRQSENVALLINTQVREDSITLYGFATSEEKQLFEILIAASGVGPKLALSILSSMPVQSFCSAIVNADLKTINRINGIGKRTAEKLIVELKDKIGKLMPSFATQRAAEGISGVSVAAAEDAIMALEQLGFKTESVRKVMEKIIKDTPEAEASSENFIRKALQALNG
jgi:Holliday junction DNA helicase RuvA